MLRSGRSTITRASDRYRSANTPRSQRSLRTRRSSVHGPAFTAWIAHYGGSIPEDGEFEDAYLGEWTSAESYAEHLLEDFGVDELIRNHVPESLRYYVKLDIAGFARDLELGGDIIVLEKPTGGVWIFVAN